MLLVNGGATSLDPATRDLITALRPYDVAIAGGPSSVSTSLESSLAALNLPGGSLRLGGADRFDASLTISADTFSSTSKVYIATGYNYPDALAGAALAGRDGAPLFLVPGGCVTPNTAAEIRRLNPQQLVILGGPNSVSSAVESLTECAPPAPPVVTPPPAPPVVTPPPAPPVVTPPPATSPPGNPGDTRNCGDFRTQREAQAWYNTYVRDYGDVAGLDGNDRDGIVCESLPRGR